MWGAWLKTITYFVYLVSLVHLVYFVYVVGIVGLGYLVESRLSRVFCLFRLPSLR